MWHAATLHVSKAALWVALIGGLGLLVALICGEGRTVPFQVALVVAMACRVTAELGHGYLWHRLQPPGRGRSRRRFATVTVPRPLPD
jgi:hypothetical protein